MKNILYILIVAGLVLTSCEDKQGTYAAIEAELEELLRNDDAFGMDGFGDEGAVSEEYEEGLEDASAKLLTGDDYPPDSIWHYRFGRRIESFNRDIQYTHEEDEVLADITWTIEGLFIIKVFDTTATMIDSVAKEFTNNFQRKIRFERLSTVDENGREWRVKEFTMGVGGIGEKVAITKLEYFIATEDSTWDSQFIMESENVLETFISREDIPTFPMWSLVKVEVTVSNEDPIYDYRSGEGVLMHFGIDRRHKARRRMFDDGEHGGDLVPLNNVFTMIRLMHGPGWGHDARVFRAFFDVMDYGTLFQTQTDVHTAFWGLPYKCVRP
ncbi:MAG: hypothetical protein H8E64_01355 [Candidatus Marinimicrobia bacterium]|nr:hypothetical protein [Candidatus Neomarinimicrobiota bacterium]